MAPSSTRSERSTSTVKSTWPGVSMMLMRKSRHSARRSGRRDRDAALLLLLHPVHDGGALVDLADLVGATRVIEDALSRRRLTGVDVRHDPDVPGLLERVLAGHVSGVSSGGVRAKRTGPCGPARTTDYLVVSRAYVARVSICCRTALLMAAHRLGASPERRPNIAAALWAAAHGSRPTGGTGGRQVRRCWPARMRSGSCEAVERPEPVDLLQHLLPAARRRPGGPARSTTACRPRSTVTEPSECDSATATTSRGWGGRRAARGGAPAVPPPRARAAA